MTGGARVWDPTGSTDGDMNDVRKKGAVKLEKVKTIELPRKAELLGW